MANADRFQGLCIWRSCALWGVGFVLAPVLIVWILLLRILAVHWTVDPQYSYGWLVPVLAIVAGKNRWVTRSSPSVSIRAGLWISGLAVAALLPTWVILQPNLDWRAMSWLLALEAVIFSLGIVMYVGGNSWLRNFAFPICFILLAVPWPKPLELPLTHQLMQMVALVSVEILNAIGVVAVQHGNLIEVRTGMLGVDHACSGVRSLQASLMAGFILGELYRLGTIRRLALVLIAITVALLTNVFRALLLAWTASRNGIESVERWHDPAGFTILAVCFLALWAATHVLGKGASYPRRAKADSDITRIPAAFVAGVSIWIILSIIATELWYRDDGAITRGEWYLVPPADSSPIEIHKDATEQLRYDIASTGIWRNADGTEWQLLFFEWFPGAARSRLLARLHRPEYCLSSTGMKLLADRGTVEVVTNGVALQFQAYLFERNGQPLHVYYGVWQNRSERAEKHGSHSNSIPDASMQAVMWRERELGQQLAELAVSGYLDSEEADHAFRDMLGKVLVRRGRLIDGSELEIKGLMSRN